MRVPPLGILKVAILGLLLSVSVSGQTALASVSGDLLALLAEVEQRISRPLRRLSATQTLRHVRSLLVRAS